MKEWLGLVGLLVLFSGHIYAEKQLSSQVEQQIRHFSKLSLEFEEAAERPSLRALEHYIELVQFVETNNIGSFGEYLENIQQKIIPSIYSFQLQKRIEQFHRLISRYNELEGMTNADVVDYLKWLETSIEYFELLHRVRNSLENCQTCLFYPAENERPKDFIKKLKKYILKIDFYLNRTLVQKEESEEFLLFIPGKRDCKNVFPKKNTGTAGDYTFRTLVYILECSDFEEAFEKAGKAIKNQLNRTLRAKAKPGVIELDRHGDIPPEQRLDADDFDDELTPSDFGRAMTKGGQQFAKQLLKRAFKASEASIDEWDYAEWAARPDITEYIFLTTVGFAVGFVATTDIQFLRDAMKDAQVNFELDLRDLRPILRELLPHLDHSTLNQMLLKVELKGLDFKDMSEASQKLTLQYAVSKDIKLRLFTELGHERDEERENIVVGLEGILK